MKLLIIISLILTSFSSRPKEVFTTQNFKIGSDTKQGLKLFVKYCGSNSTRKVARMIYKKELYEIKRGLKVNIIDIDTTNPDIVYVKVISDYYNHYFWTFGSDLIR
jgi:hypothetical protein